MIDLQDAGLEQALARCYLSTKTTAKTLFPDRFNLNFSDLHDVIYEAIDGPHKQVVIAAPRGFGKSTTVNVAYPAKKLLFREKKFIVPISCSADQAIMQTEDLKGELKANENIRGLFGDVDSKAAGEQFSKKAWVAFADEKSGGTLVFPRGAGQQVRGIRYKGHRPDLIIVDDLEDSEDVLNENSRAKLKQWFFSDVLNSVDRTKDWKVVVIGTVLHEDSLLENLLNHPDWHAIRLEICDDEYHSNWPEFISDEDVKKLSDSFRHEGLLDVFYREYRNIPISKEDAIFRQEYFNYYSETDEAFIKEELPHLENFIILDPAKTVKIHSAHSAIVGIGFSRKTQRIYIRDIVAGMFYPDEIYEHVFNMASRLKANVVGLEVTSLHEFLTYPFRNEMLKRGHILKDVELHARGKKEDRIAQLVPFYRSGHVYHNENNKDLLEEQLLTFPRCKRFDIIDAEAYLIEMLEEGNRFFDTEIPDDEEYDEYAELEDDDGMGKNVRFRNV